MEERELLLQLVFHRRKIFLMGSTKTGEHTDGGLYDVAQRLHLTRLAYACFKERHLRLLVKQPHRERHTYL